MRLSNEAAIEYRFTPWLRYLWKECKKMIMVQPHEIFQQMIGVTYATPVTKAWNYAEICRTAREAGYEVMAILEDGVVYKPF